MWHFSETPRNPPEKQKWVFQLDDLKCLKPNTKAGELKLKRAELFFLPLQILEKTGILKLCGPLVTVNVINVHTLPWNWPTPRFMNVTSLSRSADSVAISWKEFVHGKLQGANLSHKSFVTTCHHLTVSREAYGSPWGASNIASSNSAWLDGVRTRRESLRNQLRRRGRAGYIQIYYIYMHIY